MAQYRVKGPDGGDYQFEAASDAEAAAAVDELFAAHGGHGQPQTSPRFSDAFDSGAPQNMAADRPDYILHAGDVVYPEGADTDYDRTFFRPYAALLGECAPDAPSVVAKKTATDFLASDEEDDVEGNEEVLDIVSKC